MKSYHARSLSALLSTLVLVYYLSPLNHEQALLVLTNSLSTSSTTVQGATNNNNTNSSSSPSSETVKNQEAYTFPDRDYYTWRGDHWIPPKGVPTFTPREFLQYFSKRNTLFIGDSTCRRAYSSIFASMNATDLSNIPKGDMDRPSVIDINRYGTQFRETCTKADRMFFNYTSVLCRDLPNPQQEQQTVVGNTTVTISNDIMSRSNVTAADNNVTATTPSNNPSSKKGRFDYLAVNCLSEVHLLFTGNHHSITYSNDTKFEPYLRDYDLIVIGSGIWEVIRSRDCAMYMNANDTQNTNPVDHVSVVLHTLKNYSSPQLQIAIRTTGFVKSHAGDSAVKALNNATRKFFEEELNHQNYGGHDDSSSSTERKDGERHRPNMTLVDWATVIEKRSYEERIDGDIKPHYGLQARLLFGQQLLYQLILADERLSWQK